MMDRQTAALSLSTVALVPSIYGAMVPTVAAVSANSSPADMATVERAERLALATSASVVLAVGLATRTPEVVAVGGVVVLAFHIAHTHARRIPAA